MQTHLLNVTINWPRSVIFVRHSTLFTLTAINVCLNTAGKRSINAAVLSCCSLTHSSVCTLLPQEMSSCLCFFWSDLIMDWIPLRAHECRRQSEFTSVCHEKIWSWSLVTGFIKYRKHLCGLRTSNEWKEGGVSFFMGLFDLRCFLPPFLPAKGHFGNNGTLN